MKWLSLYITTLLCSFYCKHLPAPQMKTWSPGTIRGHQPHFLVLSLPSLFLLSFAPYPPDQINSFHWQLYDLSFDSAVSAFFPSEVFAGLGFSVSVSPLSLLLCLKVLLLWKQKCKKKFKYGNITFTLISTWSNECLNTGDVSKFITQKTTGEFINDYRSFK